MPSSVPPPALGRGCQHADRLQVIVELLQVVVREVFLANWLHLHCYTSSLATRCLGLID